MFMIGIDPHKGSHTTVVIDRDEQVIGEVSVRADRRQQERLLAWAARQYGSGVEIVVVVWILLYGGVGLLIGIAKRRPLDGLLWACFSGLSESSLPSA